jgi:hypothetical protein
MVVFSYDEPFGMESAEKAAQTQGKEGLFYGLFGRSGGR